MLLMSFMDRFGEWRDQVIGGGKIGMALLNIFLFHLSRPAGNQPADDIVRMAILADFQTETATQRFRH